MSKRTEQVASELTHQLSEIINKDIEIPKDCLVTIIKTEISPDLKIAKIFISVLPENKNGTALAYFKKTSNFIQRKLGQKLKFYTTPQLKFFIDEGEMKRRKINKILEKIKENA